jgi:2-dehydropantoate 2-reductase
MRVTVIGAGAIGGYVGGKLALSGHQVTLVDRPVVVEAIKANEGLRVIEPDGQNLARVQATTDLDEAFAAESELVLFSVKSYDTPAAIQDLQPYAGRLVRLLSLQNGVSNEALLADAFGADKVLAGIITHPVSVPQVDTRRSEKKQGGVAIAPLVPSHDVNSLVETFRATGLRTRACADARALKWSKLLLNLIGNATSAILDMNTRQVFDDPELVAVEIAALRETLAVMKAQEIKTVDLPGYPVRLLAIALRALPVFVLRAIMRPLVTRGRAEKLPSLLIELRRESGQSEIDELNGAVTRSGKQAGVPTPVNDILSTTLSLLVHNPDQRERWREQPGRLVAVIKAARRAQIDA